MPTRTPIQSVVLTSNTTSFTFSNIPQYYTDLVLVGHIKRTATPANIVFTFNGDNSSSYSANFLYGDGTTVAAGRGGFAPYGYIDYSSDASNYVLSVTNFNNYSNNTAKKLMINRAGVPTVQTITHVNLWNNTAPVTSITYTSTNGFMAAGSTLDLYGIRAGGSTKATGGDVVTTDGTYWYHAFTRTGSFTPAAPLSVDLLVVAGGGGSGADASSGQGGGGGAGGVLGLTSQSLNATMYPVVVGAGGTYSPPNNLSQGINGSNSQFGTLTAAIGGGGGGPGNNTTPGANGGSGGGGGSGTSNRGSSAGTGTTGQGNAGGLGSTTGASSNAGGGGGAGGVGSVGLYNNTTNSGAGGVGTSSYSSWGAATGTGHNVSSTYYYGGGGTGWNSSITGYSNGGGGPASGTAVTANGLPNTGGGGGAYRGSGASGIVIVRYAV